MKKKYKSTGYPNYFSKEIKKCLNCGKEFVNKYYGSKKRFCSISCSYEYRKKDKKNWDKYISNLKEKHQLEKHSNWQGGISFEPYSVDWTDDLKRAIRKRDKYTCQLCRKEPAIVVHHIDYDKKNCDPNNLITLCRSCNPKVNFNRKYWTNYFKKKIKRDSQAVHP